MARQWQQYWWSSQIFVIVVAAGAFLAGLLVGVWAGRQAPGPDANLYDCVLREMRGQSKDVLGYAKRACRERFP